MDLASKKITAQLELSLYTMDSFVSRFIDEVMYLQEASIATHEMVGCSFGKMWILQSLRNSYRIRITNETQRFNNLFSVAKFIYKKTFNTKYYQAGSDVISNVKKLAAEQKRYENKMKKLAAEEESERKALLEQEAIEEAELAEKYKARKSKE